jgi:hypothetical protein
MSLLKKGLSEIHRPIYGGFLPHFCCKNRNMWVVVQLLDLFSVDSFVKIRGKIFRQSKSANIMIYPV